MVGDSKTRVSTLVTHPLVFSLLLMATAAWGQSYTAVELAGGIDLFTLGSAGQAVGITQTKDGYEQPQITVDGNVKALDALHGDDGARAFAVNSSGVVAGYSCLGEIPTCSAVTWTAGGTPKAFADRFFPRAINDAGAVAGYVFEDNGSTHLAVWRNGVLSALPVFPQQQNNLGGQMPSTAPA
jgi:uncharacterized membrane protein